MDDRDDDLGTRIKRLRGRLISQRTLSERSGVSIDVIRKLEQGRRHTASVATLQRLARVLDVGVGDLLGKRATMPSAVPNAGVVAMREALTPTSDVLNGGGDHGDPLTAQEAERTVTSLWGAYWSGRYAVLAELLPGALAQLRTTLGAVDASDHARAARALAMGYQLAGDTLAHLGHPDAAWIGVRSGLAAAEQAGDDLLAAAIRISGSWQLLKVGRYEDSEHVAVTTAQDIVLDGAASDSALAAYGTLTLTAATAAARSGRGDTARTMLEEASATARRLGYDRSDHQTTFGPTKVAMMTTDIAVVQEDYAGALAAARTLDPAAPLPPVNRARHLADVAMSHLRLGRGDRALQALLAAERLGPEWIRFQRFPRQIAAELVATERRLTGPLRAFGDRIGVHAG
ncbi:helix-turn-helix domain-containing protein [Actinokineospora spheciospongiae]|uniref:helix-turn-helix domain-containing protein n=1 Tax=Actinokineospora spheciospongiae TaxID=909613 RepID=UPI000D7199CC|nr:helix-turn-helix transcriptional regulator [Actinokineospora spheciospongiae]PWW50281.1 helix-turn-helix protein [Actinokineospora spheciospongiae]